MKKLLISILFLFYAISVFAEKGIFEYKWNTSVEKLILPKYKDYPIYTDQKTINNQKQTIYYFTECNLLSAVCYFTNTEEIEKYYKNKKLIKKSVSMTKEEWKKNTYSTEENYKLEIVKFLSTQTIMASMFGVEKLDILNNPEGTNSKADKGNIYIYDYNDDTRVYIYENIIEGQSIVVYVPHEQDY